MWSPWSSTRALTLPQAAPATIGSPTRRVPRWTMTVATGPRPISSSASRTTPAGPALGRGRELLDLGDQHDLLEQIVDPEVLQGRDLDDDGVAAPRLGHQPLLGELLEHPVGVGLVTVDLVDAPR